MKSIQIKAIIAIACVGLALRVMYQANKPEFHIDEGFSAAISNASWDPAKDLAQRDKWVDSGDLLSRAFSNRLTTAGTPDFPAITHATGMDVHPPLYYWAFALARVIVGPARFALAGYALNLFLYLLSAVMLAFVSRRAFADWGWAGIVLALFSFSAVSASLTAFLRMYELLALVSLLYFACAAIVLDPPGKGRARVASLAAGLAGLGVSAFLGLMTQYYFLFCLAPVALTSAVYLVRGKRFPTLLWALFATLIGLYLAKLAFPQMTAHLTSSYRTTQSVQNAVTTPLGVKLGSIAAYMSMVTRNLVPLAVLLAAAVLWAIGLFRRKAGGPESGTTNKSLPKPVVLALSVLVFTLVIIPVSAPYITARYVGAFFPLYALALVGILSVALNRRTAFALGAAAAIIVAVSSLLAGKPMGFHEDYALDESPEYMNAATPLVIFATHDGAWKNMLPYVNMKAGRKVYVAYARNMTAVAKDLGVIASSSGSPEVVALVDDWFKIQPPFERIGYYGFYNVYRVKVE